MGICELKVRMISLDRPDSLGEHGPGEEKSSWQKAHACHYKRQQPLTTALKEAPNGLEFRLECFRNFESAIFQAEFRIAINGAGHRVMAVERHSQSG